jgi:inosine-uridine nucleoside N-ribohydrolase
VATGCLTNFALLLSVFPEIKQKIEKIVLLGGAVGIGNISPCAEFNILIDPEAAKIVFDSGVEIVMVPIEVTHTALVTPSVISRVKALDSPFGQLCVDLLNFFGETYKRVFYFDFPPLHDPLAVAYVIEPSLFVTRHLRVDIVR